jgi:hypothetical protein
VVYDLKRGEKSPLDQSDVDQVAALARERGWSNEQAQEALTQRESAVEAHTAKQMEQFQATTKEWANQCQADPEIGGEHWAGTLQNVNLVMSKFAPAGSKFATELEKSGLGNHPEFVRFVSSIGAAMREDKSAPTGGGSPAVKDAAKVLYS